MARYGQDRGWQDTIVLNGNEVVGNERVDGPTHLGVLGRQLVEAAKSAGRSEGEHGFGLACDGPVGRPAHDGHHVGATLNQGIEAMASDFTVTEEYDPGRRLIAHEASYPPSG